MKRKKELRKQIIESKCEKIIDNLEYIEETLPDSYEQFSKSRMLKDSIYKEIEFSIELVLDICSIINMDLRLGVPDVEDNILDNLEKNKILSQKSINLIREMKKFRNILVHKYGEIDDSIAYESIKEGIKDFEYILKKIENLLK
ncbi:DUF86 domain-containing protein [Candidatus Pacearchaeota archaeon CG10_big_fil_rev_8_21_14_0_10_32_14]|nr:MAG: DUF86 domain-containing protein [Candidatus Pacearchaeota archaeon CG10_big_fil_rev_8_21_14_0_10_32_14]